VEDIMTRINLVRGQGRLKAYLSGWWGRHIVADFDQRHPGKPWLF
jgi:hypothetical protein